MRSIFALLAFSLVAGASASVITVTCDSVTGVSGDYQLHLSIKNKISPDQRIYWWGVRVPGGVPDTAPLGWHPNSGAYQFNPWGATSTVYNCTWQDSGDYADAGALTYGISRDDFVLYLPSTTLPTQFQWFAWSKGEDYYGSEAFIHGKNPGFEGFSTVPEPASMAALGLGVLAVLKRRRR